MTQDDPDLTPRQEAFCLAYVTHYNAARAAQSAGYRPRSAAAQGCRLMKLPQVRARVKALRDDIVTGRCTERDDLMSKAEAVFHKAMETHQLHAAVRALQLQTRLAGLGTGRLRDLADDEETQENARNDDGVHPSAAASRRRSGAGRDGRAAGGGETGQTVSISKRFVPPRDLL